MISELFGNYYKKLTPDTFVVWWFEDLSFIKAPFVLLASSVFSNDLCVVTAVVSLFSALPHIFVPPAEIKLKNYKTLLNTKISFRLLFPSFSLS